MWDRLKPCCSMKHGLRPHFTIISPWFPRKKNRRTLVVYQPWYTLTLQVCNVLMRKGCLDLVASSHRGRGQRQTDWALNKKMWKNWRKWTKIVGLLNKLKVVFTCFHHRKLWLLHDVANKIDQNGSFAHGNSGSTIRSIREKTCISLRFANHKLFGARNIPKRLDSGWSQLTTLGWPKTSNPANWS